MKLFWRGPAHWAKKYFGDELSLEESSYDESEATEISSELDSDEESESSSSEAEESEELSELLAGDTVDVVSASSMENWRAIGGEVDQQALLLGRY